MQDEKCKSTDNKTLTILLYAFFKFQQIYNKENYTLKYLCLAVQFKNQDVMDVFILLSAKKTEFTVGGI